MEMLRRLFQSAGCVLLLSVPSHESFLATERSLERIMESEDFFLNRRLLRLKDNRMDLDAPRVDKQDVRGLSSPQDVLTLHRVHGDTYIRRVCDQGVSFFNNRAPSFRSGFGLVRRDWWILPTEISTHDPLSHVNPTPRLPIESKKAQTQWLGFWRHASVCFNMKGGLSTTFHYVGIAGFWIPVLVSRIEAPSKRA